MLWEDDTMASLENVSYTKIKSRKKRAGSDVVFNVFLYVLLGLFAIVIIYPMLNVVAYSFSYGFNAVRERVHIFPNKFTFESYKTILFERENIGKAAVATISRTVIGTVTGVFANALLAFIVSRKKFYFRSALSLFWIITIYAQGGLVTTFYLYRKMGLTNSFWVYIIPGIVSGMYVLVMRTYMKSIPDSLEEAAQLEGAGYMRIFWSVISPLCRPVYAAIALFIATTHWNSWFDALLYNKFKPEYSTLQFEVMKIMTSVVAIGTNVTNVTYVHQPQPLEIAPITLRSALAVLTMLPLLIIGLLLQKYYVSGLEIRGVKD